MEFPVGMKKEDVEKAALKDPRTLQRLEGAVPKKIILVPGKMVNIVL
jgi:leucyl-tRNA synthetase